MSSNHESIHSVKSEPFSLVLKIMSPSDFNFVISLVLSSVPDSSTCCPTPPPPSPSPSSQLPLSVPFLPPFFPGPCQCGWLLKFRSSAVARKTSSYHIQFWNKCESIEEIKCLNRYIRKPLTARRATSITHMYIVL